MLINKKYLYISNIFCICALGKQSNTMARAKIERITQPHWINMANGIDVIDKGGTLYVNSMEKFWEVLNAYVDNLCGSPYIKYKFDGHRVEGQYFTYCNNGGIFHGEGDVIKLSVGIYVN